MTYLKGLFLVAAVLVSMSVSASQWRTGVAVSYVSGINDVTDIYEDNLEAEGYSVDSFTWPVGIAFDAHYEFDSGMRFGVGVGPMAAIISDEADYYELASNVTIGYTFFPSSSASPYVKAGVSVHFIDGDYVESNDPGLLAAVGYEWSRDSGMMYSVELAVDTAEATFSTYRSGEEDIRTYDAMVSFIVKF